MPYPKKHLTNDEHVIVDLNPHWSYLAPQVLALVAAVVFAILSLALGWPNGVRYGALVLIAAALVWFVPHVFQWWATNFVVTSERVIYREGLIRHEAVEIPLDRINTVFFAQTGFERMINRGDLSIESGGETGKETFHDIRGPRDVQRDIYEAKEKLEIRRLSRMGGAAAESARRAAEEAGSRNVSIPDQLRDLAELRDSGVISPQEFEAKKQNLLDRM